MNRFRTPFMTRLWSAYNPVTPGAQEVLMGTLRKGGWLNRNAPVYLSEEALRSHTAVTGCTGSGRIEGLMHRANEGLRVGSVIYLDGCGFIGNYHKLRKIAAACGKADVARIIDFSVGNDVETNRFNPLLTLTPKSAASWLAHQIGERDMLCDLMPALQFGALNDWWVLDVRRVVKACAPEGMRALAKDERIPESLRTPIAARIAKNLSTDLAALEQKAKLLTEVFGHIFNAELNNDPKCVLLGSLIQANALLYVLMPNHKSADAVQPVGEMMALAIKLHIADHLGSAGIAQVLTPNVTLIADEFNEYACTVWDNTTLAMMRTYGVSLILSAFSEAVSQDSVRRLISLCATRIHMRDCCSDQSYLKGITLPKTLQSLNKLEPGEALMLTKHLEDMKDAPLSLHIQVSSLPWRSHE